jgi:hypothetical protein
MEWTRRLGKPTDAIALDLDELKPKAMQIAPALQKCDRGTPRIRLFRGSTLCYTVSHDAIGGFLVVFRYTYRRLEAMTHERRYREFNLMKVSSTLFSYYIHFIFTTVAI